MEFYSKATIDHNDFGTDFAFSNLPQLREISVPGELAKCEWFPFLPWYNIERCTIPDLGPPDAAMLLSRSPNLHYFRSISQSDDDDESLQHPMIVLSRLEEFEMSHTALLDILETPALHTLGILNENDFHLCDQTTPRMQELIRHSGCIITTLALSCTIRGPDQNFGSFLSCVPYLSTFTFEFAFRGRAGASETLSWFFTMLAAKHLDVSSILVPQLRFLSVALRFSDDLDLSTPPDMTMNDVQNKYLDGSMINLLHSRRYIPQHLAHTLYPLDSFHFTLPFDIHYPEDDIDPAVDPAFLSQMGREGLDIRINVCSSVDGSYYNLLNEQQQQWETRSSGSDNS